MLNCDCAGATLQGCTNWWAKESKGALKLMAEEVQVDFQIRLYYCELQCQILTIGPSLYKFIQNYNLARLSNL